MGTTIELMPHVVDLEGGGATSEEEEEEEEEEELGRECRICHMSLVSCSSPAGSVSRVGIELGCCCKDDLAAAHKHCAETWFKIKGNKICEICNSTAQNVVGPDDDIEGGEAGHGGIERSNSENSSNNNNSDLMALNNSNAAAPSAFEREQIIGMMEKEMEYRVDMFNKLTHTCFSKCTENKYKESELNMGENSCIDRCVSKYWQVTNLVGQLLGNNQPPM